MCPFFGVLGFNRSSLVNVSSWWGKKMPMSRSGRVLAFVLIGGIDQQWSLSWFGNYYYLDSTQGTQSCLASKMMI